MSDNNILLDSASNELEIIEFYIDEMQGNEQYRGFYGINVAKVLEIIRIPPITAMPNKHHDAVLGTFNLRGQVLPLVNLGGWLDKNMPESPNNKVLVCEFSGIVTAFVVSGVNHIHRLTWSQVEPPDNYLQAFSADSVTGVVRIDNRILFLLDMEQIIGSMTSSGSHEEILNKVDTEDQFGVGHKVFVVDDSQSVRRLISKILEKVGFEVEVRNTGKEAWDALQAYRDRVNNEGVPLASLVEVVVSDIEMPEMDGHTLLKNIKGDSVLQKLPVVLFSSHITEALRKKGQQFGADDQVGKPDLPTLTKRIRAFIE